MNSRKSAWLLNELTLSVFVAGSICLASPAMAEEASGTDKVSKQPSPAAVAADKDDALVTEKGKKAKGDGRKGNWSQGTQGAPDMKTAKKRVDDNPKSADAHNDLGWAYRQNGKLKEAEVELRKALELDDTIPWGHSNLSVVLLDSGRTDEAVKEGERAVGIDAKSPIFRVVYGNALAAKGNYPEATKQYNTAIQLRSDYENAYYNLGRILQLQGKNADATAVLSQALKLDPSDERVMKLLDKLIQ